MMDIWFVAWDEWSWWHVIPIILLVFGSSRLLPVGQYLSHLFFSILVIGIAAFNYSVVLSEGNELVAVAIALLLLYVPILIWKIRQYRRKWSDWQTLLQHYDFSSEVRYSWIDHPIRIITGHYKEYTIRIHLYMDDPTDETGDLERTRIEIEGRFPAERELIHLSDWEGLLANLERIFSVRAKNTSSELRMNSNYIDIRREQITISLRSILPEADKMSTIIDGIHIVLHKLSEEFDIVEKD